MANVRTQALTCVNDPIQAAQNSAQMFTCFYDLLTAEARLKVSLGIWLSPLPYWYTSYAKRGLFYQANYHALHCQTRSTVATICKSLSTLDSYMLSIQCDVEKFNQYMLLQKDALLAGGEHSSNLLTNLFMAYEAVEDQAFHYYIMRLQDSYNNGCLNFEVNSLMETALNKYKVLAKAKKWNAVPQIIALKAIFQKNPWLPRKWRNPRKRMRRRKRSPRIQTSGPGKTSHQRTANQIQRNFAKSNTIGARWCHDNFLVPGTPHRKAVRMNCITRVLYSLR